jgi:hypothetical protein
MAAYNPLQNKETKMKMIQALIKTVIICATLTMSVSAYANPSDQDPWFDITVLSAHVIPGLTLKAVDRVENCQKIRDEYVTNNHSRGTRYTEHLESFDCTAYASARLGGTFFRPLSKWNFRDGRLETPMDTPIVEVLTVTPIDRLAQATQIGFSESYMGGRVNYFRTNGSNGQTIEAGKVTLKDGRIGVVHRWLAEFQANGGAYNNIIRSVPFKPVLVRNGQQYWDQLIGDGMFKDYTITNFVDNRFIEPNSYNRFNELVK